MIALVSSCSTIALPTSAPGPQTTLSQPSGTPASIRISASLIAEIGVWPAGLSTTALPAASAGPSLWATRLSGKLKGLIAPTTPKGTRRTRPSLPTPAAEASIGTVSPVSLRASTAEKVRVSTQRWASTRAVLIGLPASAAIVIARSSSRSADQLGGAVEDRGALVLGEVGGEEGLVGGGDRALDRRRVADRHPPDHAAVVGALDLAHSPVSTHSPATRSLWSTAFTVSVAIPTSSGSFRSA